MQFEAITALFLVMLFKFSVYFFALIKEYIARWKFTILPFIAAYELKFWKKSKYKTSIRWIEISSS